MLSRKQPAGRTPDASGHDRDGEATRSRLLAAAFAIIHEHGFQGLRIDDLLAEVGLTKGAFYHHFPSKTALGLAVIDEILATMADLTWRDTLLRHEDPIAGIAASLEFAVTMLSDRCTRLGCPLHNLSQEMSPLDPAFRERLTAIFERNIASISDALRRGQDNGLIRDDVDAEAAAVFILAAADGAIALAKSTNSQRALESATGELRRYLETLRARPPTPA